MRKKRIIVKIFNKYTIFTFYNEDHTLGNVLRFIIQSNPFVEYIGYNVPHPTENIMNIKISSAKNDQICHLMLGLKNCSEVGVLFDNFFQRVVDIKDRIKANTFQSS
nr:DNA-deirected RNA polymerases I and III 16kDa polypeptide [Cryptomonas sp.]